MSIKLENLCHIYNVGMPQEKTALSDISFELPDGCVAGLIGHTGSGKSTLVQHLNGLLRPSSGRVLLSGVDIWGSELKPRDVRKRVGLVFQYPEYQLFEESVLKDVCFGPKNLGLSDAEAEKKALEALDLVGLSGLSERSPFELSGGQKRRVAIAGVLAMQPEVLILDEPTAGLDPEAREEILLLIEHIHKSSGNITLIVSHNMDDIARLADKVLVMNRGALAMQGSPREIFARGDELTALGLDLPPLQALLWELKRKGLAVRTDIFDLEEAAAEIARAKGGVSNV